MMQEIVLFFRRKKKMRDRILQLEKQLFYEKTKVDNVVQNSISAIEKFTLENAKLNAERDATFKELERYEEILVGKIYPYPKQVQVIVDDNERISKKINQIRFQAMNLKHEKDCEMQSMVYYHQKCSCGVLQVKELISKLLF